MNQDKFQPLHQPSGYEIKSAIIQNSANLAVGEVVIPAVTSDTSVVVTGGGTTGDLLGVVYGIEGSNGQFLEKNSETVASDNVTVARVRASYVPLYIPREFLAGLDADGDTTNGSEAFGNFAVEATGLLLDESTYTAFSTKTDKQFFSYGIVPGTTRNVTGHFIANITA